MSVAAWDGFLNDQSNWPAASRIGNATGATTARDTLGDKTFVKRKRMSQEERHLQILQAAVKIIATKGFWGMSLQNISDELGITEAEVVQAFLEIMSRMDFTLRQTVTGSLKKFIRRTNKQHSALQSELQDRISMALEEVSATSWPAGILDYAEAGQ